MMHMDIYHGIVNLSQFGTLIRRVADEEYEHFREKHPDGYDSGYVWITPPHEEDGCEEFRPKSYRHTTYKDGKPDRTYEVSLDDGTSREVTQT